MGDVESEPVAASADEPDVSPDSEGAGTESRGRRALQWLLARAPQPISEPISAPETVWEPESEPIVLEPPAIVLEPPAAYAEEPAETVASAAVEPVDVGEISLDGDQLHPRQPLLDRVFRRRRRAAEDEVAGHLPLPEPDASFETPWSRSPVVEPEAVAVDEPATVSEPVPEPGPVAERPRPRPCPTSGQHSSSRPTPHRFGIASSVPSPAPVRLRPAPSPPVAPGPTPPGGISGASSTGSSADTVGRSYQPDLARFLEASEAQPGDGKTRGEADQRYEETKGKSRDSRLWRRLTRLFIIIAIAGGAALLLRSYVVAPYYIPSASMEPTLHGCPGCNDDHVLVDKISYRMHDPRQRDIVVFSRPANAETEEKVLIKRVIALPSDKVSMKKGTVFINGAVLREPYLNKDRRCDTATDSRSNFASMTVPAGDLFVLGDNRCDSTDSRVFGPISQSSVVGRAFAIIWPLGRIRLL